jgi:Domain of unknown function (DUF222)/HNH endonuclease
MGLLEGLNELLDAMVAEDPRHFADCESIEELHRLQARFDCVVTAADAAFDASGEWAPSGAKTAAAWLATHCLLPPAAARAKVALGRRLRHCPKTAEAWADGDIGTAQAQRLSRLRREASEEAFERDEKLLVDQAATLRFESFQRAADYWESMADPEGTEERAEAQRGRRDVFLEESVFGMWLGKMTLDPISGAIVSGELRRREKALFDADWEEATERLGHEPRTVADLARTGAERRADAMVEMARRSAAVPPDARYPAPLFSVFVGYETLHGRICQLAQGTVLAPGAVVPWLDQAVVERAVFSTPNRVEVSAKARLFSGATRRGVELRDRECQHDCCDVRAEDCQVDHIIPYAEGGPTTQENGRLLCGFHNRLRQKRPPPEPDG